MTVTQTSIAAHDLTKPDHETDRQQILAYIRLVGCSCIADVAAHFGKDKSGVSARMNELKTDGKLAWACTRPSRSTRIESDHWKIPGTNLFGE